WIFSPQFITILQIADIANVSARYKDDIEAGWSYAKKFGYKVHTIICRYSMLPLWFYVSPANKNDGPYTKPLLEKIVHLYKVKVEVVRADSAYWCYDFLSFIALVE
ncbi:MAG: transposase, partial [Candidatus Poribacteria bacterium]